MSHVETEMRSCAHISITKWCIGIFVWCNVGLGRWVYWTHFSHMCLIALSVVIVGTFKFRSEFTKMINKEIQINVPLSRKKVWTPDELCHLRINFASQIDFRIYRINPDYRYVSSTHWIDLEMPLNWFSYRSADVDISLAGVMDSNYWYN